MAIEKIQTTDNPDFDFNIANSDIKYKSLANQNYENKIGNSSVEEMNFDDLVKDYDNYTYSDYLNKIDELNLSDASISDITSAIFDMEKRVLK